MGKEVVQDFRLSSAIAETEYGKFYYVLLATRDQQGVIHTLAEGKGRRLSTAKALAFQQLADMYRELARDEPLFK